MTIRKQFKKRWNIFKWLMVSMCVVILFSIYLIKPARDKDLHSVDNFACNISKYLNSTKNTNATWIILLIINNGYLDFFQNWFHFYRKLQLEYEVIVFAEDDIAFSNLQILTMKLKFTLIKCGRLSSSDASDYGSEDFAVLTSGRPGYILTFLLGGYNVIYADVDAVWKENPFSYFIGDFDMWVQVDAPDVLCTGLMAIKSTRESIKLMEMWAESLRKYIQIDQNAFNEVLPYSRIRLKKLDERRFPSGKLYFELYGKEKRAQAVIVHNNYIIGHSAKLQRFQENNLWFS